MRKWLILTQYYAPEIGAPQIRLRCLVKELRKSGKQVSVLTAMPNYPGGRVFPGYRGRFVCREKIDGIDVQRAWVYAATGRSFLARFMNYCSFAITSLVFALFGKRPDVVFVEAQPLPLGIVAVLMKWLRGVPYVYNVPDLQVDVAKELGFIRRPHLLRLAAWLETLLLKQAWRVSTVTHGFIAHFQSRGVPAERITFLPNGADTELLRPREPDLEYLDRWHLHGKKCFVYIGTHAFYHGLDTLIAAAEILKDRPDIRIVMVGDGPERERLHRLAVSKGLENVIFGDAPYEKTADLYSIAWAAVATLRDLPVAKGMRLSKVFPALSSGVPVIYSGAGEAAELLTEHRCGIGTRPEDPNDLAGAMRSLADDPERRTALGRKGRALVEDTYSWSIIVQKWLQQLGPATAATLTTDGFWRKLNPAERILALIGIIAISPFLAICAVAIWLEDGGPALFRQTRVGVAGTPFSLLKLRTMRHCSIGPCITAGADSRITRVGRVLRHFKLDELPQLWNVVRGDMEFIGPRPEVPEYVDIYNPQWRAVLAFRPGMTDPASLVFRDEEKLLADQADVERFYREILLPRKLAISNRYARTRSVVTDLRLIVLTIKHVLSGSAITEPEIASQFFEGKA